MSINLSLAVLFVFGLIAIIYGVVMAASQDDGTLMFKIFLIAGGIVAAAAALFMKFVFSVI